MTAALSVLQVLITGVGAMALGRRMRGGRWRIGHAAVLAALDAALGLLLVALAIFGATLLGLANQVFFLALLAILAVLAALQLRRIDWKSTLAAFREVRRQSPAVGWAATLGAVYAAFVVALALPPPSAVDELVYHLEVPRRILEAGGTVFFPDNIYAYFPQLCEMLFAFGLAVGGEPAAKLFHALFAGLLGLAVYGFSRKTLTRELSLAAAGFFLLIPSVVWGASLAYVDLAFALYGFLALVCVLEAFRPGGSGLGWAAGLMAGGAWAVKYTGLQLALLLALVILLEHLAARRKSAPWLVVRFGLASAIPALPFLLRNWAVTGWPLFPFQVPFFALDARMNWDPERSRLFLRWLSGFGGGLEAGAMEKVLSPLLVFWRARFDQPGAYDGVIGPVFLLIPILLLAARGKSGPPREVKILIGFSVAFLYYWSLTTQQVRFLLPAAPVLAYLLAFGLQKRGTLWRLAAAALLLLGLGMGAEKLMRSRPWAWWSGSESRAEYLQKRVVGASLYARANETVGSASRLYLVNMRNYGYLLDCPWSADFVFEYYSLGQTLEKAGSPDDVSRFFERRGADYMMIDENVTLSTVALEPRELLLLKTFLNERTNLVAADPVQPRLTLRRIVPAR